MKKNKKNKIKNNEQKSQVFKGEKWMLKRKK